MTLPITVKGFGVNPQTVNVRVAETALGWKASLLGSGRGVSAVYILLDGEQNLTLRLEPPPGTKPGTYRFRLVAEGQNTRAELPVALTVGQVLPRRLSLQTDLPTLKGPPSASFRYPVILKNESDQDLLVNDGFGVSFSSSGQEVTSLPVKAGESKDLKVAVTLPPNVEARLYAVTLRALAGETKAELGVNLDITGQPQLSLSTPDGRLSGTAYAGQENPVKLLVKNSGSAPAQEVRLSSSEPSGWEVKFDPEKLGSLAPGQEAQITAQVKPSPRAVAGDYMITLRAESGSASASADYRVTVQTSTLWGLVGVVLVAVAVGAVGFAVSRYGRR